MEMSTLTPIFDWIGENKLGIIIAIIAIVSIIKKKAYPLIWLHKLEVMLMTRTTEAMMWISISTTPLEWYLLTQIAERGGESMEEAGTRIAIACLLEIVGSFLFGFVMQPALGYVAKDGKITFIEWLKVLFIALIAWLVGLYFTTGVFNIYLSVEYGESMLSFWSVLFAPTGKMFLGIDQIALGGEQGIPYHIWYSIYATPIVNAASVMVIFVRYTLFHKILKGDLKNIFYAEVEVYDKLITRTTAVTTPSSPPPATPTSPATPPSPTATVIENDSGERVASSFLGEVTNP